MMCNDVMLVTACHGALSRSVSRFGMASDVLKGRGAERGPQPLELGLLGHGKVSILFWQQAFISNLKTIDL